MRLGKVLLSIKCGFGLKVRLKYYQDKVDSTSMGCRLKSLLQHHSSKASILWPQLSLQSNSHIHPYMTTEKTIALTRQIFVGKVMYLLFNMLSRFVIAFLPRSKHLLISAAVTICSDFGVLVLEGLVGFHGICQLQLLLHQWLGHRLGLL